MRKLTHWNAFFFSPFVQSVSCVFLTLRYLTRGAHLNSVADAKWYMELGEEVEISEFVRNLTNKLVRASKYYFMSSMAPGHGAAEDNSEMGGAGGTFLTEPTLA